VRYKARDTYIQEERVRYGARIFQIGGTRALQLGLPPFFFAIKVHWLLKVRKKSTMVSK